MSANLKKPTATAADAMQSPSAWKIGIVAALCATETSLEGLPIPAARACISLVLKVIQAHDVAVDNEQVLVQLNERCQNLKEFLLPVQSVMVSSNIRIPEDVQKHVNDLQMGLEELARKWEPRLVIAPRKRDIVKRLFKAESDRDTLKSFMVDIDRKLEQFLVRFTIVSWLSQYRQTVKSTRKTVLATIEGWALHPDPHHPPIFWLNGLAGIGKTTIARTVASWLDTKHRLGGSFVFLRTDDQLKDGNLLFPTFALQLSSMYPAYKTRLAEEVESHPDSFTQSPTIQFEILIRRPLSAITISEPLILILDALDECQPNDLAAELLGVLLNDIKNIPFLRVFITSRPEGHIREALALSDDRSPHQTLVLHQDMAVQAEVEEDIRLYLQTSLQEIWDKDTKQTGAIWPTTEELETLVQQSGRLFIYAATAVRFIGGNRSLNLKIQLQNLLKVQKNHVPNDDIEPYLHLDLLYLNILETAFAGITDTKDKYYHERFQNIVGGIVLTQQPLPLGAFANFLHNYSVDDITQTLYYLHSIFIVPDKISEAPRSYHLSFPNFVTHRDRCTNENAYINPQKQEKYLFLRCLAMMEEYFGPVIQSEHYNVAQSDSTDPVEDEDDSEPVRTDYSSSLGSGSENDTKSDPGDDFYEEDILMSAEIRYSCNHWCSHLINIEHRDAETTEYLARFIEQHFSSWLAQRVNRLSLTDGPRKIKLARNTIEILHSVHRWTAASHEADSPHNRSIRRVIRHSARTVYHFISPPWWESMMMPGFTWPEASPSPPLSSEE